MLYTFKDSKFLRRGSPVGPMVAGVYAMTKVMHGLILFIDGNHGFHSNI
jgi:hypothetical protein